MTYYIYKATNKLNGKVYIGCTKNIGGRLRQHIVASPKDNPIFHSAIREDGVTNFTWEIVETAEYADDAFDAERRLIKECNSLFPNGYNQATGGAGAPGFTGRRVVRLNLDGSYAKTYESANSTERDGFQPGQVVKVCNGTGYQSKGNLFMWEDDYLENGPRRYTKPQSHSIKAVIQCDLHGNKIAEYESVALAASQTGSSRTSISACLAGTYKTANGFIWVYPENYPIKDLRKHKFIGKGIRVAQLDAKTDEVIAVYDSIVEAANAVGGGNRFIQKMLDMPGRTAYGFKWKRL